MPLNKETKPKPPVLALTEFFHVHDVYIDVSNIHLLNVRGQNLDQTFTKTNNCKKNPFYLSFNLCYQLKIYSKHYQRLL